MKLKITRIVLMACMGLCSCSEPSEYFIGKWQIVQVVEKDQSLDLIENWMHLKSDGTFESYDGNLKKNEKGKWTYQAKEKVLFIDGEGENADSEWALSVKSDTLIFQSTANDTYLLSIKVR